jgi:signal transduction histidine kinase
MSTKLPQRFDSGSTDAGTWESASGVAKVLLALNDPREIEEWGALSELVPGIECTSVVGEANYREAVDQIDFDAVIFAWPATALVQHMVLPELKLRNQTPGVIVVAQPEDPLTIATLYNSGCHRFVPMLEGWTVEVSQALRGLLRARRAESAHERTRARLTEMLSLLEEKNARLDEFSVTLAHDVRGPLAGISMKLDYILDSEGANLSERSKGFIAKALESTRRLTDLIQAMYEYARVGARAKDFSLFSLHELVQNTIGDLHVDERRDVSIGIGDLPRVWGKPELLQRVFLNLIQNAIKYADKDQIVVNISAEGRVHRALGTFVTIMVEDNGPGVPDDAKTTLFSMFSRGRNSSEKGSSTEGLGAGLAVVQRVIELHFGKVWVENAPHGGARFMLLLPTHPVEVV